VGKSQTELTPCFFRSHPFIQTSTHEFFALSTTSWGFFSQNNNFTKKNHQTSTFEVIICTKHKNIVSSFDKKLAT
jgi:hypothetical protein